MHPGLPRRGGSGGLDLGVDVACGAERASPLRHVVNEAGCGLHEVREVVESLALLQNAEELDPAAATTLFPISAQSRA